MKALLCLAILFALTPMAQSAGFFPLGVWYEGGVGAARQHSVPEDPAKAAEQYDRDFADIAAHGINCVAVPNTPAHHHKVLLDAAEKHHLKLIIELGLDGGDIGHMIRGTQPLELNRVHEIFQTVLKPIQSHPALWKVQLLDEPALGEPFARYAKIANALRQFDPDHAPFCCLAGVGHIEQFGKITQSDLIAWDHYPISTAVPAGDAKAMRDFASIAAQANTLASKAKAKTWAVLQCHSITGQIRFPTPAEVRCMTYSSLAAGSRGIFWFLYGTQSLDAAHTVIMSGLRDQKRADSDRWQEVARLTKQINALAPVLNSLTPVNSKNLVSSNQLAKVLKDQEGRFYVFAVNLDAKSKQKVTLRFGSESEVAGESQVFKLPEEQKISVSHEGAEVLWDQDLAPGDGALFRIE
jgi:hypothetical protein